MDAVATALSTAQETMAEERGENQVGRTTPREYCCRCACAIQSYNARYLSTLCRTHGIPKECVRYGLGVSLGKATHLQGTHVCNCTPRRMPLRSVHSLVDQATNSSPLYESFSDRGRVGCQTRKIPRGEEKLSFSLPPGTLLY